MKLLTKEILRLLPKLGATEKDPDPKVILKLFDPTGSWTWYITEYDGEDTMFGLVHGHDDELGYISLGELTSFRGPMGLGIERDIHWNPDTRLSQVRH